jgi:hypothetical protein
MNMRSTGVHWTELSAYGSTYAHRQLHRSRPSRPIQYLCAWSYGGRGRGREKWGGGRGKDGGGGRVTKAGSTQTSNVREGKEVQRENRSLSH